MGSSRHSGRGVRIQVRIFYVGRFEPRTHSDVYIARAMVRKGHEVFHYDDGHPPGPIEHYLRVFKPELIFLQTKLKKTSIEKIHYPGAKIVAWWGDQRGIPSHTLARRVAPICDWFLITNSDPKQLQYYKGIGAKNVAFWPLAAQADIYKPTQSHPKFETDIAFTGSVHPRFPNGRERRNTIYELGKLFRVRTYGSRWGAKGKLIPMKPMYLEDLAVALSSAKLTVSMNNYVGIRQYQSHRTWTNMSCGCCVMNRYEPAMEEIFEDKKHVVFWRDLKELIELVKYYLSHEEERKAIGRAARELIVKNHTFAHRIDLLHYILAGKTSGLSWDRRL